MSSRDLNSTLAAVAALQSAAPRVSRTHIHKFLYLAEAWGILPRGHVFTLYRYGPYSFDLDGELQALRSVGVVEATADPSGYGADYKLSEGALRIVSTSREPAATEEMEALANWLAPLPVKELEAIATTEYVRRTRKDLDDEGIVRQVLALKPHLGTAQIENALTELRNRARD